MRARQPLEHGRCSASARFLLLNGFVLESNVLAVKPAIAWNLRRDSDSLRLRTDGFGDWNFDQEG